MMEILSQFLSYLRRPSQNIYSEKDLEDQITELLKLFFIVFASVILLMGPIMTLIGIEDIPNKLEELQNLGFEKAWMRNLAIFGLAVVAAPIIEEIVFRFPLKYRRGAILLGLVSLSVILFSVLRFVGLGQMMAIGFAIGFGFLLLVVLWFTQKNMTNVEDLVRRFFPVVFYLTALLFAYAHIANYEIPAEKIYVAPLLVVPQFLLGLMLGFVRVKYGLWASIFLHAMNNLIPTMALIFMTQ